MKALFFGLSYLVNYLVQKKAQPSTRGLVLTNRCNLRCRHCRVRNRGAKDLTFGEVLTAIQAFHDEGGRCLYLEGGEPFLWLLKKLLADKHRYKILNSKAGLKSVLRNDWRRPSVICSVYEQGIVYQCCRYSDDAKLCSQCGYLSYAEVDQTLKLKPSAISNAWKYFGEKSRGPSPQIAIKCDLPPNHTSESEVKKGCRDFRSAEGKFSSTDSRSRASNLAQPWNV